MRRLHHSDKTTALQFLKPRADGIAVNVQCLRGVPVAEDDVAVITAVETPFNLDVERTWAGRHGCPCLCSLKPLRKLDMTPSSFLLVLVRLAGHCCPLTHMFLTTSHPDLAGYYDRLAPDYDRLHRRWLKHAGGEAQAALEATVRAVATSDMELLDAGCGTGAFARRLLAEHQVRPHVTLLDPSDAMLARCADIPAERVQGRLEQLPFKSSSFDIVVCAWALETATCTERALCELCRMVRPGGIVCLAFCAEKPALGPGHRAMQLALSLRGSGRFLRLNVIDKILKKRGDFDVRTLPCNGPATALIARRDNLTK